MTEAAALKVGIIEDDPKSRDGLRSLIGGTDGCRCVGAFGSMEEALAKVAHELPDVLLVDIGLPGMSGIEGTRRLKDRHPALAVLMLTVYDDDRRIFDAMCAGACGYLLKKTPPARLLESLKEVVGGGAPMSPEVARRPPPLRSATAGGAVRGRRRRPDHGGRAGRSPRAPPHPFPLRRPFGPGRPLLLVHPCFSRRLLCHLSPFLTRKSQAHQFTYF